MRSRLLILVVCCLAGQAARAGSDRDEIAEQVLQNRLSNLESQAVQRRGRSPTIVDLLNRQDRRLAEQALNALKTRDAGDRSIPLLERRLDRHRHPRGLLER
ncbi:MAG: hypothetical protein HC871_01880 [Rhizobiales bacterium]|nr:hypothetical protein [Hyphomicrobiales bacterium]